MPTPRVRSLQPSDDQTPVTGWRARLREDESGISLIEVLVAVMLLGLIMGALARTLTSSMFGVQEQQFQVRATALAQELLEEAAGIPWKDLGLCESETIALHPTGEYTHDDGTTEPLVLIPDTSGLCAPTPSTPVRASATFVRDGISYAARTIVSWSDEDGVGSTDDLKHILVDVNWETRSGARSTRSETYLAPDAVEAVIVTEVIHAAGQTYTYLNPDTLLTMTDVTLRASAVRPQSLIEVRWRRSDGTYITPKAAMDDVHSNGLVWEELIPNGSPDFDVNRLANGETLFEFTATDAENNASKFESFDRGLFLLHPDGLEASLLGPPAISVDAQGALCASVTLRIAIRGFLGSDIVTATWAEGFPQTELIAVPDNDPMGATFEATYDSGTISPPTEGTAKFVPVTVKGTRIADNEPLDHVDENVEDSTQVDHPGVVFNVEVVQGC